MPNPIYQTEEPLTTEEFIKIYGKKEGRYELINGRVYMMAAPNTDHQRLSMFLSIELGNFFKGKKCQPFAAPYDVFLNESPNENKKNKRTKGTVVQPDLMVICDKDKIKKDGCHGAPDFIIEIGSDATIEKDFEVKLYKYYSSGVKEYWLIVLNESEKVIYNYRLGMENNGTELKIFTFKDKVKSNIFEGLEIDFTQFSFD